ncbi:MAG TPA: copper chaperone PCu(A)C [Usitatibacteraceae bacterium]
MKFLAALPATFRATFPTTLSTALLIACTAGIAQAQLPPAKAAPPKIVVTGAWVKTTIPGGSVSAAYMQIQSPTALKLLKVEAPIAGDAQIHDMKMNDGVMEMKELDSLAIPAGQMVELKPGGRHVMLMNLTGPIRLGDNVPLKLVFEGADKKKISVRIKATAREREGDNKGSAP